MNYFCLIANGPRHFGALFIEKKKRREENTVCVWINNSAVLAFAFRSVRRICNLCSQLYVLIWFIHNNHMYAVRTRVHSSFNAMQGCRIFCAMFLLLFFKWYYRFFVRYSFFWEGGFSLIKFLAKSNFPQKKLRKVTRKSRQIFYVNFPIFFMLKFRNFAECPSQFLLNRSKKFKIIVKMQHIWNVRGALCQYFYYFKF